MGKLKAVAELFEGRHFDREVIILCVRVRFAPDSPLEEAVTSEPVSEPKFPVMQGKYREFHRFEPRSPRSGVETAIIISALRANSLRSGTGN